MEQAKQPKKYLQLSDDDLAKVKKHKERQVEIDEYQLLIAEYGYYFGYEGMRAILNDEIHDLNDVIWQVVAARKVRSGITFDMARAVLAGAAAPHSKKPDRTFKNLTKDMIKNSKADI